MTLKAYSLDGSDGARLRFRYMDRQGGGSDDRSRTSKMDASEVRRSWARVLESVKNQKKAVIIVRYRRPIAALVPIAHLPEDDLEGI